MFRQLKKTFSTTIELTKSYQFSSSRLVNFSLLVQHLCQCFPWIQKKKTPKVYRGLLFWSIKTANECLSQNLFIFYRDKQFKMCQLFSLSMTIKGSTNKLSLLWLASKVSENKLKLLIIHGKRATAILNSKRGKFPWKYNLCFSAYGDKQELAQTCWVLHTVALPKIYVQQKCSKTVGRIFNGISIGVWF